MDRNNNLKVGFYLLLIIVYLNKNYINQDYIRTGSSQKDITILDIFGLFVWSFYSEYLKLYRWMCCLLEGKVCIVSDEGKSAELVILTDLHIG